MLTKYVQNYQKQYTSYSKMQFRLLMHGRNIYIVAHAMPWVCTLYLMQNITNLEPNMHQLFLHYSHIFSLLYIDIYVQELKGSNGKCEEKAHMR